MTTTIRAQWQALAEQLSIRSQAWINDAYTDAIKGTTFDCISPIDERRLAQVASCDAADVDRTVAIARAAFVVACWSRQNPVARNMTVSCGGYKQFGNGCDKSLHALVKYTELKSTWIALETRP